MPSGRIFLWNGEIYIQAKVYDRHNQAGNEVLSAALLGPICNKLQLAIKILPGSQPLPRRW